MAKSIIWRSETAKFEVLKETHQKAELQVTIHENTEKIETWYLELTLGDIRGLEDILSDIRFDIESDIRDAEAEKEVGNG